MRLREIITKEACTGAGIVEPREPMTPAQASREAKRKADVQKRIKDQQVASARKVADLRAKLT